MILGNPIWVVLVGFLLMQGIAGLYLTVVFQLAHVVEGPEHHDAVEEPVLPTDWAVHQMRTTANFATHNKFITWMVGGLNHQIEHHLFPNISHIHYHKISNIVKATAREFNIPYHEFKRVTSAIASHAKVLKMLGNGTYQMAVAK